MLTALLLFFFAFGTVIGSFLNVVVLRYGTRRLSCSLRLSSSRSLCFSCGKLLHWYELVPVASFLAQRGRCRGCKAGISFQYPLVELLTGLVFALVAWKHLSLFSPLLFSYSFIPLLVIQLTLWSLLIALSVYDLRHKILPDGLVYSGAFVSFFILLFSYWETYNVQSTTTLQLTTYNFFSGFLLAAPFALIWFFSKGRAMGLGDAKLILFFPWLLGFAKGLSALIIGFWLGAVVSVTALLLKGCIRCIPKRFCPFFRSKLRHVGLKTELPLGPFLVLGLFLVYLFGWDVTGLSLLWQ